jgi:hypothetical protein
MLGGRADIGLHTPVRERRPCSQPRSQGLSFCHLGETLAAAGHVPPRFWEVNLIVTVRGVGKERVCSVLKLQLWVMKFTVNWQQEIVKRTLELMFIS